MSKTSKTISAQQNTRVKAGLIKLTGVGFSSGFKMKGSWIQQVPSE